MKKLLAVATLFLLSACGTQPVGNPHVPQPAKAVELERYLGKWYEIARYDNRFEKGCEAVTADYSKRDDGLIQVVNTCHKGALQGEKDIAGGKAKMVEGSNGAKLKVSFFGPFYFGNYWVLDRADDYSWSIVGEPSGKYLWLLARKPVLDEAQKQALLGKIKHLGYDTSLLYFPKHEGG